MLLVKNTIRKTRIDVLCCLCSCSFKVFSFNTVISACEKARLDSLVFEKALIYKRDRFTWIVRCISFGSVQPVVSDLSG